MEPKSYPYTAQVRQGSIDFAYRPFVDVQVGGQSESRQFKALVDSGTDVTVMDKVIADLLNIDLNGRRTATLSGVGESKSGLIAPVSLEVSGFPGRVFSFEVIFAENLSDNFEIILGQQDFFRNFNVTFKKSENIFYLELVH